ARAGSLAATGQLAESHAALVDCINIAPQDWRVRVTTACAAVERLLGLTRRAGRPRGARPREAGARPRRTHGYARLHVTGRGPP
ncbi:MAG: hypothetical protein ACXVII_45270, partial [Solirubrobacteraceae bacterium]